MKKSVIFLLIGILMTNLMSCGSMRPSSINHRDDRALKYEDVRDSVRVESMKSSVSNYQKSMDLTYQQIAKGQVQTDGQGLLVIIANEKSVDINTIVVGPLPDNAVNLGIVPENVALFLFQGGNYSHRSYFLEASRRGIANYEEDYLAPGKYVAFSLYRGQPEGHGWCFQVTAQLVTYKGKKVHGYTVMQ